MLSRRLDKIATVKADVLASILWKRGQCIGLETVNPALNGHLIETVQSTQLWMVTQVKPQEKCATKINVSNHDWLTIFVPRCSNEGILFMGSWGS